MRRLTLLLAGLCVVGNMTAALADNHAEAVVKYRQTVMKAIGAHTGAIAAVAKGQVEFGDHVAHHAASLAEMGKISANLFPPGTGPDAYADTGALNDIWTKEDEFKTVVAAFQDQSAKLAEVAKGGDMKATMAEFRELGKTCGGCHKPFRQKK